MEQDRQQVEKVEISLTEIFFLNPEIKKGLHPHAAERHSKWLIEVLTEIAQFTTTDKVNVDADLDTYLNDADKAWAKKYKEGILEWLWKCTNLGEGYSCYSPVYYTSVTSDMSGLKSLIRKAYEARAEKLEAERRQIEWEEKWDAASEAINPPDAAARKYLSPEEYQKYKDSIPGAVRVYIEKRKLDIGDGGSFDYRWWSEVINNRREEERQRIANEKEEERQKIVANFAAQEYNRELNKEIANLRAKLDPQKKNLSTYFQLRIKDKHHTGHNFDYVLSKEEEENPDRTLVRIANERLKRLIPNSLSQFIDIPSQYYRIYFPLPSVSYSFAGVPCLDFAFDIFAAAYGEVWLKPGKKSFGDYEFHLPRIEERNYSVLLQEPKLLGYYYLVLKPEELGGYTFWQTIPLVLLKWLLEGGTKPPGITISEALNDSITYKIPKFKEEVDIPDKFANYLKNIGNIDEMVSKFKMNEKVASIVRAELGKLKVEHKALSLEEKTEGKHTKKAKAFQLFSQGKGPSTPEVKALDIHKSTRFKYYNEYLASYQR